MGNLLILSDKTKKEVLGIDLLVVLRHAPIMHCLLPSGFLLCGLEHEPLGGGDTPCPQCLAREGNRLRRLCIASAHKPPRLGASSLGANAEGLKYVFDQF